MHVNKTKFECNSSLEYYHMTSALGKQNIQAIKRSVDSDAAHLPYLIHQLGLAH